MEIISYNIRPRYNGTQLYTYKLQSQESNTLKDSVAEAIKHQGLLGSMTSGSKLVQTIQIWKL